MARFRCRRDRTGDFHSLVSRLESRPDLEPPAKDAKRILRSKPPKDGLEGRARDVAAVIGNLRRFLADNRALYLSDDMAALGGAAALGEDDAAAEAQLDRDRVDAGANVHIQTCGGLIGKLRRDVRAAAEGSSSEMRARHLEAVCGVLESALKAACRAYAELQAIRVNREVELRRLSRLEFKTRKESESSETLEDRQRMLVRRLQREAEEEQRREEEADSAQDVDSEKESSADEATEPRLDEEPSSSVYQPHVEDDEKRAAAVDEGFSPEERQVLEKENAQLYNELVSVQDSVQQVETKVVKIAELQEIFTEKVVQQSAEVEAVARNAVTATENVKDGNEEIRKAIQNQASIRVYVLFFLLVMSFSLLFLDWYND